jgi:hypothetical protein
MRVYVGTCYFQTRSSTRFVQLMSPPLEWLFSMMTTLCATSSADNGPRAQRKLILYRSVGPSLAKPEQRGLPSGTRTVATHLSPAGMHLCAGHFGEQPLEQSDLSPGFHQFVVLPHPVPVLRNAVALSCCLLEPPALTRNTNTWPSKYLPSTGDTRTKPD